jgi:hypothetical protein
MRTINLLPQIVVIAFITLAIASSASGQGGPPMLTDDSATPGDGKWEMNFAFILNGSSNNSSKNFPIADLNFGIGTRIQLKTEFGWAAGTGEPLAGRFDYISPGLKYRFLDESESGFSVSTFPSVTISFQPEDRSKKIEFGFFLPLEISKEISGFSLNAQAGYHLLGNLSAWAVGLVAGRDLGTSVTLLAELHSILEKANGAGTFDAQTFLDLGAQINASEQLTILIAIGKEITSPSISSRDANFYGYFGFQLHL